MFKRAKLFLVLLASISALFITFAATPFAHAASRPNINYCQSTHLKELNSGSAQQGNIGNGDPAAEVFVTTYEIVNSVNSNCGFDVEFQYYDYSNSSMTVFGGVEVDGAGYNPISSLTVDAHKSHTEWDWYYGRCISADGIIGGGTGGGTVTANAFNVCV